MSKKLLLVLFPLCFIIPIVKSQSVNHKDVTTKLVAAIDSILNSQVVNDQIPAEGARKIPVTEEY